MQEGTSGTGERSVQPAPLPRKTGAAEGQKQGRRGRWEVGVARLQACWASLRKSGLSFGSNDGILKNNNFY